MIKEIISLFLPYAHNMLVSMQANYDINIILWALNGYENTLHESIDSIKCYHTVPCVCWEVKITNCLPKMQEHSLCPCWRLLTRMSFDRSRDLNASCSLKHRHVYALKYDREQWLCCFRSAVQILVRLNVLSYVELSYVRGEKLWGN